MNKKLKARKNRSQNEVYRMISTNLVGKLKLPKGETALSILGREDSK